VAFDPVNGLIIFWRIMCQTKICRICHKDKSKLEFRQNKNTCDDCEIELYKLKHLHNVLNEKVKKCKTCNKIKLYKEFYRNQGSCIECRKQQDKIRHYKNKKSDNKRRCYKRKFDENFRIKETLRARIRDALTSQSTKKTYKTIEFLGCTIKEFRKWLKSQFKPGMTWENRGQYGWHVDHIIPCASFDLTDPKQQLQCFHYTNLQPLW
jgi:hypothetical protein